jgi:hypothetical protein
VEGDGVVAPVNGEELLPTDVCRLGSVLIGGKMSEGSNPDRTVLGWDVEVPVEGRFFCNLRGGLGVVSKNAPPPKDIRCVKELERLWVWLVALEDVDLDQRLRLTPCSEAVTDFEIRTFWVETGAAAAAVRSRLLGLPRELKEEDLWC